MYLLLCRKVTKQIVVTSCIGLNTDVIRQQCLWVHYPRSWKHFVDLTSTTLWQIHTIVIFKPLTIFLLTSHLLSFFYTKEWIFWSVFARTPCIGNSMFWCNDDVVYQISQILCSKTNQKLTIFKWPLHDVNQLGTTNIKQVSRHGRFSK